MCTHQTIHVDTADGWRLALQRITAGPVRWRTPVLLLHGFGANGFVLWHEGGSSLGRYLARLGFDVWLLEFRGTRSSRPPDRRAVDAIRIDDKICQDLPAALRTVRQRCQVDAVDVIGHSLGGTVLYAYLSHLGEQSVRRCATIAAPLRFRLPVAARWLGALSGAAAARLLSTQLPMRGFARLGVHTNIVLPARPHFNLRNVRRSVLLRMMAEGIEDPSLHELSQLARWSAEQRLLSWDRSVDYGARLGLLRTPMLLLGGAADAHVEPEALEDLRRRLRAGRSRLVVVGSRSGARLDYGHTDLLLGPEAERDVFTWLSRWLETGAVQPREGEP